jgi:hypothetical protein
MKFLNLSSTQLINVEQVRSFTLCEAHYDTPQVCRIIYVDGTSEDVAMDEKMFADLRARLHNCYLIVS